MRLSGTVASVIVCVLACPLFAADHELAVLTKQLDSGSVAEKTSAVRMLGEMGPGAGTAVPSLVKILESDNAGLRYEAIVALGMIGSDAKQVVPALGRALADKIPLMRLSAVDALRKFGPDAQASVPDLKKALDDKEQIISVSAARAIMEIELGQGPNVAQAQTVLLAGLKSDRHDVAVESIHGLAVIGTPAVPAVQALIGDHEAQTCVNACDAIAAIGQAAAKSVDQLIAAAKSHEVALRWHAISALGDIGPDAKAAVPTLIAALTDPDAQVKYSAEQSLKKIGKAAVPALLEGMKDETLHPLVAPIIAAIGPDAVAAVPALTKMLQAKDPQVRREAILALAAIGPEAKSTIPELLKSLSDKQSPNRPAAAFALGKLLAKEAIPVLKQTMNDMENPILRLASVWALLQIDPSNKEYAEVALPQLVTALENPNPEIRREAARTLGRLGPQAKTAIPGLQKLLHDESSSVRRESLIALAEMGPEGQTVVPDIVQVLTEGEPSLRSIACYALGSIGAAAKPSVPLLRRLLSSRDAHEKFVAAWAVVQIAPDQDNLDAAIPILAKSLKRAENPEIRAKAAEALGKVGANSTVAKEALKGALKDPDESVRKAVEAATTRLK